MPQQSHTGFDAYSTPFLNQITSFDLADIIATEFEHLNQNKALMPFEYEGINKALNQSMQFTNLAQFETAIDAVDRRWMTYSRPKPVSGAELIDKFAANELYKIYNQLKSKMGYEIVSDKPLYERASLSTRTMEFA